MYVCMYINPNHEYADIVHDPY